MNTKAVTIDTYISAMSSASTDKTTELKGKSLFEPSIFFGLGKKIMKYDPILFWGSTLISLCGKFAKHALTKNMGLAGMAVAFGISAAHGIYLQNLGNKLQLNSTYLKSDKQGEKYQDTNIIIIDDFNTQSIETLGTSHGKLVKKYITENLPGATIHKRNLDINEWNTNLYKDIIDILKDISNDIDNGKKYDAINMSFGLLSGVAIKNLYVEDNGKKVKITKDNMVKYKTKLQDAFIKNMYDNKYKRESELGIPLDRAFEDCNKIKDLLKEISNKGVKIFLANNNFAKNQLFYSDLFDIDEDYEDANNPNIIMVSSSDDKMKSFPLSDIQEKSNYELRRVNGGIDITEDGIADIILDECYLDLLYYMGVNKLGGNSFGTPATLAKYIKEQHNKTNLKNKI